MQRHKQAEVEVLTSDGRRQMDMFVLDPDGMLQPNIIFVIPDLSTEPMEYYPTVENKYHDVHIIRSLLDPLDFRYVDKAAEKARKKGKLTVQTSITKLELMEYLLCESHEVMELAELYGANSHSLEFLTYALATVSELTIRKPRDKKFDWSEIPDEEHCNFFMAAFSDWFEALETGELSYQFFKEKYANSDLTYQTIGKIFRI